MEIRRAALVSCRRLLPRMHLAGYSASILHPLLRVLDGGVDELRTDALDTICSLALALGPDFPIFAPTVRKVRDYAPCSNCHPQQSPPSSHHPLLPSRQLHQPSQPPAAALTVTPALAPALPTCCCLPKQSPPQDQPTLVVTPQQLQTPAATPTVNPAVPPLMLLQQLPL